MGTAEMFFFRFLGVNSVIHRMATLKESYRWPTWEAKKLK